jgi:limonene-1,2-epoxide hydrolase
MSVTWFWSSIMSFWLCQVYDVLSGQPMSWRFTKKNR